MFRRVLCHIDWMLLDLCTFSKSFSIRYHLQNRYNYSDQSVTHCTYNAILRTKCNTLYVKSHWLGEWVQVCTHLFNQSSRCFLYILKRSKQKTGASRRELYIATTIQSIHDTNSSGQRNKLRILEVLKY